jgi:hypothetical protein
MSGDVPVRFCERLGVRLPRATHPVIIFERERDAQRVLDVLPKRLAKYGLTLHPEKTRLVDFRQPSNRAEASSSNRHAQLRPGTFDLFGVHSLLGEVPQGLLGGEAENSGRPLPARIEAYRGVVSPLPS